MQAEKVLTLENRRDAMAALADEFDHFCAEHSLPRSVANRFQVALDELLTNTITYGYPDTSARRIDVHLRLTDEALEVLLIDDAHAFNPFDREAPDTDASIEDRPIGGLGIHLVTRLMHNVEYRRENGLNHVSLSRRLDNEQTD